MHPCAAIQLLRIYVNIRFAFPRGENAAGLGVWGEKEREGERERNKRNENAK